MANIVEFFYGKLIAVISKETNEEYVNDWRNEYLERPGLIIISQSERNNPGKKQ